MPLREIATLSQGTHVVIACSAPPLSLVECIKEGSVIRNFQGTFKTLVVDDFLGLGHDQILLIKDATNFSKARFLLTDLVTDFTGGETPSPPMNEKDHSPPAPAPANLVSISQSLATRQLEDATHVRHLQANVLFFSCFQTLHPHTQPIMFPWLDSRKRAPPGLLNFPRPEFGSPLPRNCW